MATAETCRKCGRVFISARKCAGHEMQCTEQMPEGGGDHPCRIWGQSFPDRVTRNTHQLKCNGTADLILQCKYCRDSFESIETRIRHEGSCTQKQAHLSQDQSAWTCPQCQWKLPNTVQGPSKRTSAQEKHTRQCRGSGLANRTCNKCHTVWDSMVARIAHELYCKTDEEKRTCRYCQHFLTQSTKDTTTKSDTDGKATYKPHMQLPHMKSLPTMVSTDATRKASSGAS